MEIGNDPDREENATRDSVTDIGDVSQRQTSTLTYLLHTALTCDARKSRGCLRETELNMRFVASRVAILTTMNIQYSSYSSYTLTERCDQLSFTTLIHTLTRPDHEPSGP